MKRHERLTKINQRFTLTIAQTRPEKKEHFISQNVHKQME